MKIKEVIVWEVGDRVFWDRGRKHERGTIISVPDSSRFRIGVILDTGEEDYILQNWLKPEKER